MSEDMKRCPFCDELIRKNAIKCRHCGSILSSDTLTFAADNQPDTLVKQVLGETYEILNVIGSGGMAVVFKATQKNLQRPVALKVIHQNLIHEKEFVDRFLREARVGASLSHENIVTIYDVGSIGTVHYMAMEFLEGQTLREIIRKTGKLTVNQTIKYIVPIAEALTYLHSNNLVHRDIKTANVIVTNKQRAVLTDFGIVFVRGETRLSQAGTVVGTPEYMSPEQATGKVEVDRRADIYSLGVMVYECLTGKVPFHSSNPLTTVHSLLNDRPKEPKLHVKSIPMWLNKLILDCLVKDPDNRIQDCSTIANALKNKDYKGIPAKARKKQKSKKEASSEEFATLKISGKESQVINGILPDDPEPRKKKWLVPLIVVLTLLIGSFSYLFFVGPPGFLPESFSSALDFGSGKDKPTEKGLVVDAVENRNTKAQAKLAENVVTATTKPVEKDEQTAALIAKTTQEGNKNALSEEDLKRLKEEQIDKIRAEEADRIRKEEQDKLKKQQAEDRLRAAAEEKARQEAAAKERLKREAEARRKAEMRSLLKSDQLQMLENMGIPMVLVKSPGGNYYIGKYEVTQKVWQNIMNNNPSENKGQQLPVESVSKYDIVSFLTKLNQMTSLNFRLPTVDEWLYAAKAQKSTKYSGSNLLSECGWYEGNTNMTSTKPVGGKLGNGFGIYDMSGNVAEMCADGTVKGGSYLSPTNQCELTYSEAWEPNKKDWTTGFRLLIRK